jgi:hypothetical protein
MRELRVQSSLKRLERRGLTYKKEDGTWDLTLKGRRTLGGMPGRAERQDVRSA